MTAQFLSKTCCQIEKMDLKFPELSEKDKAELDNAKKQLENEK